MWEVDSVHELLVPRIMAHLSASLLNPELFYDVSWFMVYSELGGECV